MFEDTGCMSLEIKEQARTERRTRQGLLKDSCHYQPEPPYNKR
jgi:hypothetical protein